MDEYKGKSLFQLRLEDYKRGVVSVCIVIHIFYSRPWEIRRKAEIHLVPRIPMETRTALG